MINAIIIKKCLLLSLGFDIIASTFRCVTFQIVEHLCLKILGQLAQFMLGVGFDLLKIYEFNFELLKTRIDIFFFML